MSVWKILSRNSRVDTGETLSVCYRAGVLLDPYIEYRAGWQGGKYTIREHYGRVIREGEATEEEFLKILGFKK